MRKQPKNPPPGMVRPAPPPAPPAKQTDAIAEPMDVLARIQILANRDPQSRGDHEYHRREARAAEKAIARVAELLAADKDFDSANAAVGQAMLGTDEAKALAMSAWIKADKRRAAAIRAFEGRV